MELLGKMLLAKKNAVNGDSVIVLVGSFKDPSGELNKMLSDEFHIAAAKVNISAMKFREVDEKDVGSPEDFLEHMDSLNWKGDINSWRRYENCITGA